MTREQMISAAKAIGFTETAAQLQADGAEIEWLRRVLTWCRPRLKSDIYRGTFGCKFEAWADRTGPHPHSPIGARMTREQMIEIYEDDPVIVAWLQADGETIARLEAQITEWGKCNLAIVAKCSAVERQNASLTAARDTAISARAALRDTLQPNAIVHPPGELVSIVNKLDRERTVHGVPVSQVEVMTGGAYTGGPFPRPADKGDAT